VIPLPSQASANDVVNGVPGSVPRAVGHYLGRAAIVGLGIYLFAGERRWGRAAVEGLAGSAAIEAFVLAWCWFHKDGA
jgi:hypothetical protein